MKNLRLILDLHKPTIVIANFAFDMALVVLLKTAMFLDGQLVEIL